MEIEKIYAWDKSNGCVVCRIRGHKHGDGQVDSDETPVWLVSSDDAAEADGYRVEDLPEVVTE